ncbi:MAG: hypothetical protein U1C96_07130 [Gallionella sp.]|nr:hypothetical protein [Gallionella sp.]
MALVIMLVILVTGIAAVMAGSLNRVAINNARQEHTSLVLAQAKEALIGYAVTYGDTHPGEAHGYLPCPDMNGDAGGNPEGSSETCGGTDKNTMGRLPWRTLQLPTLRDSEGECLWYAVSGSYKNNPKSSVPMNWDNTGKLKLHAAEGGEISPDEIVAVIIAPGRALPDHIPSQDRHGTAAPVCGGNYTPAAYLDHDTVHALNNADISAGSFILPHEHRDAHGSVIAAVNDSFAYITRQEIWEAIQKRIVGEAKKCLDDYAAGSGGRYPWAVPLTRPTAYTPFILGEYAARFGRLPARPGVQMESSPAAITELQSGFAALWTALANFSRAKTAANLALMKSQATIAKTAAEKLANDYAGEPLHLPAGRLKEAASSATMSLVTSSSNAAIVAVQQSLAAAVQDFVEALPEQFAQASGMAQAWPASCELFSSVHWEHWKEHMFFHVAEGYEPGSAASCTACLSLEVDGHMLSGSGAFRAAIIASGKGSGTDRIASEPGSYLEADNLLPMSDAGKPYKTYRTSEANYRSINDVVRCLDGGEHCP